MSIYINLQIRHEHFEPYYLTWSEHQYQIEDIERPNTIPVHGKSDFPGAASRNKCIASLGTSPQRELSEFVGSEWDWLSAVASKYCVTRLS